MLHGPHQRDRAGPAGDEPGVNPMSADPQSKIDPSEDTGVADVRVVRDRIAAHYNGDLRKHVADTDRIVEPWIEKLGLKQGVPARNGDRRSGTEG
jgi:hypothetical protein